MTPRPTHADIADSYRHMDTDFAQMRAEREYREDVRAALNGLCSGHDANHLTETTIGHIISKAVLLADGIQEKLAKRAGSAVACPPAPPAGDMLTGCLCRGIAKFHLVGSDGCTFERPPSPPAAGKRSACVCAVPNPDYQNGDECLNCGGELV